MRHLKLKDGVRSTVYATIVQALKSDPTLKGTIHPDGWRTYTDEDDNDTPPGEDTLPAIEIMPYGLAAQPASLITQESSLGIGVNIATEGLDVRDLLNLWEAVEGALFKGGDATLLHSLKAALSALGKGQVASINLTSPAITPVGAELGKQIMAASGTISVNLRIPK